MPIYQTLITAAQLRELLPDQPLIFDARFSLDDTEAGRRAYQDNHIPGARYVHLDDDLSAPIIPGKTGRHPLPTPEETARRFGEWGISPGCQVIVYDDKRGAIAARLWWMLRWLGHEEVAVLEGGWPAWEAINGPATADIRLPEPADFTDGLPLYPRTTWIADRAEVDRLRQDNQYAVIDSRAPERYRGEVEPIDPIAGHIEGAQNLPFADNWLPDGTMKAPADLRLRFMGLEPEKTVFYCGSGVTACHNLLAFAHAGLGDARLYPGSWSDWINGL